MCLPFPLAAPAALTLLASLLFLAPASGGLVNRWSFNNAAGDAVSGTNMVDSVSGAVATIRGGTTATLKGTFTGSALTLPGSTNGAQTPAATAAYVDLPNGIISSKTNLTVEVWATPLSAKNWMRVFDFGRVNTAGVGGGAVGEITGTGATASGTTSASDDLMLSFCRGTNLAQQRMETLLNGGSKTTVDSGLTTATGMRYHYVMTFEDGVGVYGSGGGQVTWYRDGLVIATGAVPFHLSNIEDVNNWLGRSQYSGDTTTNASYDEVRISDHAFSPAEVVASRDAGPDALPAPLTPGPLAPPKPVNRWSFNTAAGAVASGTTFPDTISGAIATVRGIGATSSGAAISLPGTTTGNQSATTISAYIDLPNGIVSSKPNFTMEAWASPLSSQANQRLFDVGRTNVTLGGGAAGEVIDGAAAPGTFNGYDNLVLSLNSGATFGRNRLEGQSNNAAPLLIEPDLSAATTAGNEYHYVVTVEDGAGVNGSAGSVAKFYRDGVLQTVLQLDFHLGQISDVNNWIGRSQYSADRNSNVAVNEFRLYDRALTQEEIKLSYERGADASFDPPVTQADAVTMHAGQKVRIPVLSNDSGAFNSATVQIVDPPDVGTATVDSAGRILYAHDGSSSSPVSFTYRVYGQGGYSAATPVTITFANTLRIANPALAMPTAPPPTSYLVVDALPGLTFTDPICIASAPGETKRLFICERKAKIQLVPDVTASAPTRQLFLDLQQVILGRSPVETIEDGANAEFGLLGLAFHPNYASNGYFYVAYSVRINGGSYYERISRFQVSAADPNVADPASELILLQQLDEGPNHNGGDLHFGPDGYLYYAAGDEENGYDKRLNSQKVDKDFFAGIFRIDVDKKPGNLEPNPHAAIPTDGGIARFSVPIDNPFVPTSQGGTWDGTLNGVAVADLSKVRMEFWALGLRHPWRFSFDSLTGDLWAGDVGQDKYEEVDQIQKGGNYGWVYREGLHDTNFTNPAPPPKPAGFTSIDPVYEYPHTSVAGADPLFAGNSVVGGYVYRGTRFASLSGKYIFCDSVSGSIWSRDPGNGVVTRLTGVAGVYGGLVSMGVDPSNQDLLFCDYINKRIVRLATSTLGNSFPATLSATGLFADLSDLSPNPGLLPYDPNLRFWSDYAIKRRWFAIPNGSDRMTWAKDANWAFPTGAIWVKHFDLETVRGDPSTKKRIETRVLVKTDSNVYGVSYRWNDAQTEATLVPDEGAAFNIDVVDAGTPHVQRWNIPSRSSCLTCHTPQAGGPLSFTTRQLNRSASINGFFGNQLTLLHDGGYFENDPGSPNLLPRHLRANEMSYPVEARVRSFLAVNCSYCHRADGTVAGANWDGSPQLTLAETGLINGIANNNGGNPANKYVVPGDLQHSIVLNRVAATNGFTRMPPLATTELDPVDIALIQEWISQALPARVDYPGWRQQQFGSAASPEGDPSANPDGDETANLAEFLAGTAPLDGASAFRPALAVGANAVTMSFDLPALRSFQVETSTDLKTWALWDVPGNDGLPMPGGHVSLSGPSLAPNQFFRVKIWEN
jgi:glucose/arabinose dehydrogenase